MAEVSEEQAMELEALQSIYSDDIVCAPPPPALGPPSLSVPSLP